MADIGSAKKQKLIIRLIGFGGGFIYGLVAIDGGIKERIAVGFLVGCIGYLVAELVRLFIPGQRQLAKAINQEARNNLSVKKESGNVTNNEPANDSADAEANEPVTAKNWIGFAVGAALMVVGLYWSATGGIPGFGGISDGKDLYKLYKALDPDVPLQHEEEFVNGQLISTCKVGGKYDAYFGWFTTKLTFFLGSPVKNPKEGDRLYVFYTDMGNGQWLESKAGEDDLNAMYNTMKNKGCKIPKS